MKLLRSHPLEALLFVFVFGSTGYFYNGYGWNQTARYDAIWAFVEPGPHQYSFAIDDFLTDPAAGLNTGDFAQNPEHSERYYANKAPGTTLLGVPAYFALFHAERLLGIDPAAPSAVLVNAYLLNLWVSVLPLAISAVFFLGLATGLTGTRTRGLLLTLVLYAGTLIFPFATSMWGHTTAAAFVILALAAWVRPGPPAGAWAGLWAGLAVLTDYGAAPVALTLVVASLVHRPRRERVAALAIGGLGPLIVFGLYHWALFGSALTLASSFSPDLMVDEERVLGLFGGVSGSALWGLTFSRARGLFVYMPVLLVSVYCLRGIGRNEHVTLWGLAAANIALLLLINATFNGWHGGVVSGPRYQIVALPFYVLLLALLPEGRSGRAALYALAVVSFANMFVLAAVSPMTPNTRFGSPLFFSYLKIWQVLRIDLGIDPELVGGPLSRGSLHFYPTFQMREWSIALTDPVVERWAAFNLGERLLGLRGVPSLVPVAAFAAGLGAWMARIARADDRAATPD